MSVMAEQCPNIIINVVDLNEEKIKNWNNPDLDKLPVYVQIKGNYQKYRNKNLFFSNLVREKIEEQIWYLSQ